jgi:hypothetical protein
MLITSSRQRNCPPRRNAFRLLRSAGPLAVSCLLYTSAWGASTVYVVQSSGNDQNNGATPTTAVKSVARGLALAAAGTEVQIAAGLYDEQLPPIFQGVTLSGGWDPSFDPNKRTLLTAQSLRTLKPGNGRCGLTEGAGLTCLTNSNGDRVITLRSPGSQALRQLVVLGPDLSKNKDGSSRNDGSSSFGIVVDGAAGVRLDYVSIEAGNGAVGVAGENKLPPAGTCGGGAGGAGGHLMGSTPAAPNCGLLPPAGAGGSIKVNGVVVAQGGAGGATGATDCMNVITDYNNLSNGQRGGNGQDGVQGPAGAAAPTDPGQFTYDPSGGDLIWVGNQGGRGGDGSAGAGGGGGAAGDTADIYFWCGISQPILGGDGHQGGAGGCGGGAGGGGSSGGGAFALVVADTRVGSAGVVLFGGEGGEGGGGGSSSDGTLGVHDDSWGSGGQSTGKICSAGPINGGTGGQGGYGGKGGGGGGGGGGNGGPSIQLVSVADGALTMDANATLRYAGGRSGAGGNGGKGVQDNNAGPPGNGGVPAEKLSVPLIDNGPKGYAFCAAENGTCNFSGTRNVAYGANGSFAFQTADNGIACNNAAFGGDPISGTAKACYMGAGYAFCAAENGTCSFSGTKNIAYGANGSFVFQTATNGIACNNTTFGGDPIFGTAKACYIGPEGYAFCAAAENGTCSFSGTKNIAYGANGKFVFQTATNGIACNKGAFSGDPIFGVVKACYLK